MELRAGATVSSPVRRAAAAFHDLTGAQPVGVWWAPGRLNLIGEHTDYNDGFVLPMALAQGMAAAARPRADGVLRVRSLQTGETVIHQLPEVGPDSVTGWSAYVAGVGWALQQAGHDIPGLDLVLDGDVPIGGGLSSSAALECSVAMAWRDLAGLDISLNDVAGIARRAENDVVGAPTGLMDQMASLHGRAGHLVFLDTRSMAVEHVPFDPSVLALALLVVNTNTPHALVDGEYAERHRSCTEGARRLGVEALRDISVADLGGARERLGEELLYRRVRHVVTENARVLDVVGLLRAGADPRRVGVALTASHASMRDDFQITVPQVDSAVDAALAAGAHGARMTGGGFGGCVLALVEADAVETVIRAIERAQNDAGFTAPSAFVAQPSDGAAQRA
ncbi:MAG: galactokinase [Actinomycetota bacterium]|nr:galactokinase [Actinomycetota bacterium]